MMISELPMSLLRMESFMRTEVGRSSHMSHPPAGGGGDLRSDRVRCPRALRSRGRLTLGRDAGHGVGAGLDILAVRIGLGHAERLGLGLVGRKPAGHVGRLV